MRLTQIIEALLFASDAPLSAADLAKVDERLDEDTVQAVIEELKAEYDAGDRSFSIYEVAGGYQLLTRPEFIAVLERYQTVPQPSRLSTPALEVLAIIAYRQPLGRVEVEEIRGVSSSGVLKTLQDRGLIEAVGRSEALGRPLLYGTTSKFMEHFGFRSLEDLPRPDELPVVLRSRHLEAVAAEPQPEGDVVADATTAAETSATADGAVEPEAVVAPPAEAELVLDRAAADIADAAIDSDPAVPVGLPGELLEAEPTEAAEVVPAAVELAVDGPTSPADDVAVEVVYEQQPDSADRGA